MMKLNHRFQETQCPLQKKYNTSSWGNKCDKTKHNDLEGDPSMITNDQYVLRRPYDNDNNIYDKKVKHEREHEAHHLYKLLSLLKCGD